MFLNHKCIGVFQIDHWPHSPIFLWDQEEAGEERVLGLLLPVIVGLSIHSRCIGSLEESNAEVWRVNFGEAAETRSCTPELCSESKGLR